MSEVNRYLIQKTPIGTMMKPSPEGNWIAAEDFDRVTAERDAALESIGRLNDKVSCMSAHVLAYKLSRQRLLGRARARELLISELQQHLTAADDRADVLEGLLRRSMLAMSRIYEAGRDFIVGSGSDCDSVELMMENDPTAREIRAVLKPAEVVADSCEFCKGWGFRSNPDGADEGCGACNGTGKEPSDDQP